MSYAPLSDSCNLVEKIINIANGLWTCSFVTNYVDIGDVQCPMDLGPQVDLTTSCLVDT